ncbi:MFS transporter [Bacillus sp. A301a_S52]|nr:MFS transporter [Bacillus sp. A301a_S52]
MKESDHLDGSKALFQSKVVLYTDAIFKLEVFFAPVMVAFYLNYMHVSFSQMSLFFSLVLIMTIILEVPCGTISDLMGRKKTFLIGKLIYLIAMVSIIFFHDFQFLIIIAFMFALGNSLSSENLHSLVVENLLSADVAQEEFFKIDTKANSIGFIVGGVAAVIGGYLGSINLVIPLLVDIVLLALLIIVILIIINDTKDYAQEGSIKDVLKSFKKFWSIIKEGTSIIINNKFILFIFVFGGISFGVIRTGFNYYQPLLEEFSIDLAVFGWILFSFNIVSALSSYTASKVPKKSVNNFSFVFITIGLMLVSGLILLFTNVSSVLIIIALGLHQIIRGFSNSYLSYSINKELPNNSDTRTTILSAGSFIRALVASILMSVSGYLTEFLGLSLGFALLSLLGTFIIVLSLIVYVNQNKNVRRSYNG